MIVILLFLLYILQVEAAFEIVKKAKIFDMPKAMIAIQWLSIHHVSCPLFVEKLSASLC